MSSLDCYFYLDENVPEDIRIMQTFCVDCMEKLQYNEAFFWQGSMRGYGAYKITCQNCNTVIHEPEEE